VRIVFVVVGVAGQRGTKRRQNLPDGGILFYFFPAAAAAASTAAERKFHRLE